MVEGLLGVLKSGGAYVPIDPATPPARIGEVLEGARARVVVTQVALLELIPTGPWEALCLDRDVEAAVLGAGCDHEAVAGVDVPGIAFEPEGTRVSKQNTRAAEPPQNAQRPSRLNATAATCWLDFQELSS